MSIDIPKLEIYVTTENLNQFKDFGLRNWSSKDRVLEVTEYCRETEREILHYFETDVIEQWLKLKSKMLNDLAGLEQEKSFGIWDRYRMFTPWNHPDSDPVRDIHEAMKQYEQRPKPQIVGRALTDIAEGEAVSANNFVAGKCEKSFRLSPNVYKDEIPGHTPVLQGGSLQIDTSKQKTFLRSYDGVDIEEAVTTENLATYIQHKDLNEFTAPYISKFELVPEVFSYSYSIHILELASPFEDIGTSGNEIYVELECFINWYKKSLDHSDGEEAVLNCIEATRDKVVAALKPRLDTIEKLREAATEENLTYLCKGAAKTAKAIEKSQLDTIGKLQEAATAYNLNSYLTDNRLNETSHFMIKGIACTKNQIMFMEQSPVQNYAHPHFVDIDDFKAWYNKTYDESL